MTALADEYAARASVWSDIQDWLPTLYETVAGYPHATVLELGVRRGNSTAAFLAALEDVGGQLWSVDVRTPAVPPLFWQCGLWTCRIGDDCDPVIADALPAQLDVLFIDTSHHYDHTLAELRLYVPRVRPGGTVLMHDTELEQPEGFDGEPFPVARAIDTYCAEAGLAWDNRPGCFGLGVIHIAKEPDE